MFVYLYLEVEDPRVLSSLEALSMWDDSGQNVLVQGQRGDGGEQPAVTWMMTDRGRDFNLQDKTRTTYRSKTRPNQTLN